MRNKTRSKALACAAAGAAMLSHVATDMRPDGSSLTPSPDSLND